MKLAFKHFRLNGFGDIKARGGATVAYDHSVIENIKNLEYDDSEITINIGASVCSKKDAFCKSIGRVLATERLKPVKMLVVSDRVYSNLFKLQGEIDGAFVQMEFLMKESGKISCIDISVDRVGR